MCFIGIVVIKINVWAYYYKACPIQGNYAEQFYAFLILFSSPCEGGSADRIKMVITLIYAAMLIFASKSPLLCILAGWNVLECGVSMVKTMAPK